MATDVTSSRPLYRTAFALPDSRLEVWDAESTFTEAGPLAGVPQPAASSALRPVMTGTPTTTTPIELETVRGGFADAGAAFRWRPTTTPASDWRQWHGAAAWKDAELVLYSGAINIRALETATLSDGRAVVAVVVTEASKDGLRVLVEQTDGTWSNVALPSVTPTSGNLQDVAVVVIPGDQIQVYFETAGGKLCRYTSDDLGVTWSHTSILISGSSGPASNEWTDPPSDGALGVVLSVSVAFGSGRMLMAVTNDSPDLFHFVSDDYGYTWELIFQESVVAGDLHVAAHYSDGVGWLVARKDAIKLYADPYSSSSTDVFSWTRNGTLWEFVEHAGVLHLVEFADGDLATRGAAYFHWSDDNGQTWTEATAERVNGLGLQAVSGATVGQGKAQGWAFVADTRTVWARKLGGWSTLTALQDGNIEWGWNIEWVAHHAHRPATVPNADGGVMSEAVSGASASAASGVMQVSASSSGDYIEWEYDPDTVYNTWLTEASFEAIEGKVDLSLSTNAQRVRLIADADAGTLGLYSDPSGSPSLLGSTVALPSGPVIVRVSVDFQDDTCSAWYRTLGDEQWTPIAEDESPGGTSSLVAYAILRCEDLGSDLDVVVHSWRIRDGRSTIPTDMDRAGPFPRRWSSDAAYLQGGLSVSASGHTSPGESWTSTPAASYEADNLLVQHHPSPRTPWRALADTDQTIAFRVAQGQTASAHVLLVQATNARSVQVQARISSTWTTYGTLDLFQAISDYTVIGAKHVLLGTATASSGALIFVREDELVGGTFEDDAGGVFTIEANTAGVLPQTGSGNGSAGQRVLLQLSDTPASSGGACEIWRQEGAAILHHELGDDITGIRVVLKGGTTTSTVTGALEAGNIIVAPITWIPENPDETRSRVHEIQSELEEEVGGYAHEVRTEPDRQRLELQWSRLLPMYAAAGGDHDFWHASGADSWVAATAWSTPQVIRGFVERAGRSPFVYLSRVTYSSSAAPSLQTLYGRGEPLGAYLVQYIPDSWREEGVTGHADTPDQLVRTPTISLREVV